MPDFSIESRYKGLVAGFDEVGCGPWAGPVVAGSVVFYTNNLPDGWSTRINDSKLMTPKNRREVYEWMARYKGDLLDFGVGIASVAEIDILNIRQAALLAMRRAFDELKQKPDHALVDGIAKPTLPIPVQPIKKGDVLSLSIAAASILAKVTRDQLMETLAKSYPAYGWEKNAGYGTPQHQAALRAHGVTPHHRRSFSPIAALLIEAA